MDARINIDMDNDSFKYCAGFELARILRDLAEQLEDDENKPRGKDLFDCTGHKVGWFEVLPMPWDKK